jgi:hypothetical protein
MIRDKHRSAVGYDRDMWESEPNIENPEVPVAGWFAWHERMGPILTAIGDAGTYVRYGPEQRWGMLVPDDEWDRICGADIAPIAVGSMAGAFTRRLLLFPERASGDLAPVNPAS